MKRIDWGLVGAVVAVAVLQVGLFALLALAFLRAGASGDNGL